MKFKSIILIVLALYTVTKIEAQTPCKQNMTYPFSLSKGDCDKYSIRCKSAYTGGSLISWTVRSAFITSGMPFSSGYQYGKEVCFAVPSPGTYTVSQQVNNVTESCDITIALADMIYSVPFKGNDITNRQLDTQLPVGTIQGIANVSNMGTAQYNIPIGVPVGTNGLEPKLSIVYDNNFSLGLVGKGWNLSGLSQITRTGLTISDGVLNPIAPSIDLNVFSLDGSKLEYVGVGNNPSETIYKSKNEDFSEIILTSINNNAGYFTVKTKAGITYEYGKTPDSKAISIASSLKYSQWNLSKVTDNFGNYMEYKYISIWNELLLDEIRYSGNVNKNAPYNIVSFNYEKRKDNNIKYFSNSILPSYYLLKDITIKAEGNIYGKYNFKYAYDNLHSYLKEVELEGSDGLKLNTTQFKYGEKPHIEFHVDDRSPDVFFKLNTKTWNNSEGAADMMVGNFENKGKNGVVIAEHEYVNGFRVYTKLKVFCVRNGLLVLTDELPLPNHVYYVENQRNDDYRFGSADFDGDGLGDLMKAKKEYTTSNQFTGYQLKEVDLHHAIGDGKIDKIPKTNEPVSGWDVISGGKLSSGYHGQSGRFLLSGDFDGDSRTDYLTILSDFNSFDPFLSFPALGIYNVRVGNGNIKNVGNRLVNAVSCKTIDFDGNGVTDIMITNDLGTKVITFEKKVNNEFEAKELYSDPTIKLIYNSPRYYLYIGEFNGDGKTDCLWYDGSAWQVMCSDGLKFNTLNRLNLSSQVDFNNKIVIGDFDGNGFGDIAYLKSEGVTTNGGALKTDIEMFYNDGGNFISKPYNTSKGNAMLSDAVGDFNGDGKDEILTQVNGSTLITPSMATETHIYNFFFESTNLFLEQISDGFNRVSSFVYKKTDYDAGISQPDPLYFHNWANRAYPLSPIHLPGFLVESHIQPNGIGGTTTTNYRYEDAVIHRGGLGFLGYSSIRSKNSTFKTASVSIFDLKTDANNKIYIPYLRESISTVGSITTTSTNEYDLIDRSNNRWWLRPKTITSTNSETGATTVQEFTEYDDVTGDLKDQIVKLNVDYETLRAQTVYEQRGLLSVPTKTTVTKKRKEDPSSYTVVTSRTFGTKGELLTEKVLDGKPDQTILTSFEDYNDFGQPKFKKVTGRTIAGGGIETRTTEYTYSSNGRFLEKTKNSLGQESSVVMDPKWGKPLTETPISGLVTTNTYDGFGRLKTSLSQPRTVASTITYEWGAVGSGYLYKVTTTAQGKPKSTEYFDILERSIKVETDDFGGKTFVANTTYDVRGNVYQTESPHHTTGAYTAFTTTTNSYDDENRLYRSVNTNNNVNPPNPPIILTSSIEYSANGLEVKTTDPAGKWMTTRKDVSGNVVETEDAGGVVKMTYYSHGGLKETKIGAVTLSTALYDPAGRQISLTEPNCGTSTYKYNAFGELIEQQIAGGGKIIFTYNLLGQMKTKQDVSLGTTTTYTYFPTGSAAKTNALNTVTGFKNHELTYDYDGVGRMTYKKERIKNKDFVTTYAYEPQTSVLTDITFPNGVKQKNEYDANNIFLNFVKVATSGTNYEVVFEPKERDALGNYRKYNMLNGRESNMKYDVYGYPQHFQASGIQDLSFDFKLENGVLNSREDFLKGQKETFTYDPLERLKTITGPENMSLTYENNGNIKSKTGLGAEYHYESSKIHAVTKVDDYPTNLNRAVQDVTYTPFHQADLIKEKFKNGTHTWLAQIKLEYGDDYERRYAEFSDTKSSGSVAQKKYELYYADDFEELYDAYYNQTTKINYIYGGDGLCAMIVDKGAGPEIFSVYKDYLGSILTVINSTGTKHEQSFDAWGRRRGANDWKYSDWKSNTLIHPSVLPTWLHRGYTGHEHYDGLSEIVLINMNARLYDPVNGRMLRWDIALGVAGTQGYNRYSYANNNPLKFTDPSGNFIDPVTVTALFVVGNGLINVAANWKNINSVGAGLAYFGVGAASGYAMVTGNVIAAGAIQGYGNAAVAIATGQMPDLDFKSTAKYLATETLKGAAFAWAGEKILAPVVGKVLERLPTQWFNYFKMGPYEKYINELGEEVFTSLPSATLVNTTKNVAKSAGAVAAREAGKKAANTFSIRNGGDNVRPMNIVREIRKGEKITDIVKSAQERTFGTRSEHAVVTLGPNSQAPGARVLVSGGPDGISFKPGEVTRIFGHTHPYVTGPSFWDRQSLNILGQSKQYIYEEFNPLPIIAYPFP